MKARLIETGEWLTVNPCDDGFYDVDTHNIYDADELDFPQGFDWDAFRREAAKDILAAIISGDKLHCPLSVEEASNVAIQYADELIKQLKEDKK